MYENQSHWTEDQMERAGIPDDIKSVIRSLLTPLWESDLDANTVRKILTTTEALALGHALVSDQPEAVWMQAKPGMLVVRDQVRIKADAYDGAFGADHNGREGTIVAMRSGVIHVRYDGEEQLTVVMHRPEKLEKRIR